MPAGARMVGGLIVGTWGCYLLMEQWRENRSLYASNYGSQYYNGDTLRTKWDDNWDCRKYPSSSNEDDGDDKPKTQRPTATRYLYLIRHGQYVMADQSEKKILTEIGRHQAALTGKRLSQLGIPYTALHHSTMVRAVETAVIISDSLPDVPVKTCQTLCEGAPILPEPEVTHWTPKPWQFFQDGARIENAFRQYFHRAPPEQKEDSHDIIICHANVIRYFVCRALQLPPEAWLRMSIGNCGITRIVIRPSGRVSLKEMGGTGHLPSELLTFN